MKFLIKIGEEIMLKSKGVRKEMIKKLKRNIKTRNPRAIITGGYDHLFVEGPKWLADDLACTAGISHFFPVDTHDFTGLPDLFEILFNKYGAAVKGKTFCLRVRRTGQHDFSSVEAEKFLSGGFFQKASPLRADLKNAEMQIKVEIRQDKVNILGDKITGLSGFPLSSGGKILAFISGGIDSPVSTQMMIKKGNRVDYCFFNFGGQEHQRVVKRLSYFLWEKYAREYSAHFWEIPFEKIMAAINETDHRFRTVLLKRAMFQLGAQLLELGKYDAIVTGESLAQVSSQTIVNLSNIDAASQYLVLRPLLGLSKNEIVTISKKIGSYALSAGLPEFCSTVSAKPSAEAKLDDVIKEEKKIPSHLLDEAFANSQASWVKDFYIAKNEEIKIEKAPAKSQIIDINEEKLHPDANVLHIVYHKIIDLFPSLPQEKNYQLYCAQGLLSQEYYRRLRQSGYLNVFV